MKERHSKHGGEGKHHAEKTEEQKPSDKAGPVEVPPPAEAQVEQAELDQLKDRLVRLQADFDNFRKRAVRERAEYIQCATEDLVGQLLPILDHFELGLNAQTAKDSDKAMIEGFRLVYNDLLTALTKAGLRPIDAELKPFDPAVHEAVAHLPSEEHPADTVVAQTRRGYMLGEKLLRAAQVVVSSGPAGEMASGQDDQTGEKTSGDDVEMAG